ncbi:hypothetical protein [Robertmurraya kyonggiensis]|uniref:hypothetical protein n=1 Tax=Robertmurraya kyonggiensis TaxID=1037680 RepID=UPI001FE31D97|nr:hypothetical protein [Robertmurraya kyonggiensis]
MMTDDIGGKIKWFGIVIVVISALVTQYYADEINLLTFFIYYFVFRFILDLILIFLLFYVTKKAS